MISIFSDMIDEFVEVFMDDFSIYGLSFDHCLLYLEKVLTRCEEIGLVLSSEKSHFMVQQGIVLGHVVSERGLEVDKAVHFKASTAHQCQAYPIIPSPCWLL
jgi:hypothetical protein